MTRPNDLSPNNFPAVREQNARRIAAIMTAVIGAVAIIAFIARIRSGAQLTPAFLTAGLAVTCLISYVLCRRGRSTLGMALIIWGAIIAFSFVTILTAGLGTILAVAVFIVSSAITLQALPPDRVRFGFTTSFVGGVLIMFIELFWPFARSSTPAAIQAIVPIAAGGLTLIFAIFIARQFSNYNLRTKFVILFLIVAIAPIAVLVPLNNRIAETTLTAQAGEKLAGAAAQTAVRLDTFISNNLTAVSTEAQMPMLGRYLALDDYRRPDSPMRADVVALLDAHSHKDDQFISSYALLDNLGANVVDTDMANLGVNKSDRDYYQVPLMTGRPYVSPFEISPTTGRPSIYFSAPVFNDNGAILGVLRVRYEGAILQSLIEENNDLVGPDSFAVLFDENLVHLAHGAAPETIFTIINPADRTVVRRLQTGRRLPPGAPAELILDLPDLAANLRNRDEHPLFTAEDVATAERLNQVAVVELETQPWLVTFFQPEDVFLAPLTTLRTLTVILAVGVAVAAIVAALLVARFLARPVAQLTDTAVRIAEGDLDARAPVTTGDELGLLAGTFNTMADQLRETLAGLEERVAERTRAVETSARVSRSLSTILDPQQLLKEVVEQVQSTFNYYHAQIYLLDEAGQKLRLAAASGYTGQLLAERKHQLEVGHGLVGQAAREKRTVLAPDVNEVDGWLPNTLLPDTRSEIAVPIAVGDDVLGVLDVQHSVSGGLDEDTADLLTAIASQVAVALQNARLFEATRRRAEREAQLNRMQQRIQSAPSVESVVQIAAEELGEMLGGQRVKVQLGRSSQVKNGRPTAEKQI